MSTSFPIEWNHYCEVAWDGISSLPFLLKRKQDGSIRVSKLKESTGTAKLGVGNELKFVAGLPVHQLSLKEVKKVILAAPKPVLLVFYSYNDNPTYNGSFITDTSDSGSIEYKLENTSTTTDTSSNANLVSASHPNKLENKKGSRLKLAFRRMNDLLNRPVRQSALNISSEKSIIV
jgi:hypothetical protein